MKPNHSVTIAMPKAARFFIGTTVLAGLVVLAAGLAEGLPSNAARFVSYLALTLLASMFKVKLPGITGSISVSFLFILVGVAEFTFGETVLMGCLAGLVQCLWKPRRRPMPAQVAFNVATLALSIGVAYWVPRVVMAVMGRNSLPVTLGLASALYFACNTFLVTMVLSLVERKRYRQVWNQCYLWAFPYYLVGAALAAAISASSHSAGWGVPLLLLPLMYMVYSYYRLYVERAIAEQGRLAVPAGQAAAAD